GKNTLLHRTTAGYTPPHLGHKSFAASCPLALLGSASYPILVHRFTVYDPRFLPTVGRPSAVALHFVRCGQLTGGLSPPGVRPCRAHKKSGPRAAYVGQICCALWSDCMASRTGNSSNPNRSKLY